MPGAAVPANGSKSRLGDPYVPDCFVRPLATKQLTRERNHFPLAAQNSGNGASLSSR
jgi:hypothetical protein